MKFLATICVFLCSHHALSQTLGGASVYNFLKLPASPQLSASGGVNVSYANGDAGLAMNNPATISEDLDKQLALNFNAFFAGTRAYQLAGVRNMEKSGTRFGAGIVFLDYGNIPQADASGNSTGEFRPVDFAVQVSAARSYLTKWHYGATLKFIYSGYGPFRSSGSAIDVGVLYKDTAKQFSAGLLVQHMGWQWKTYSGNAEELPFELQAGISKRLPRAPFGFSLTAQQLHRFDTDYNDTAFNNENGFTQRSSFTAKLFNHLVVATHIYAGAHIEASLGYNFLRRRQLNIGNAGNGLNGFSAGFTAKFNKFRFQYARAYYQRGGAYNQAGLQLDLGKMFRL